VNFGAFFDLNAVQGRVEEQKALSFLTMPPNKEMELQEKAGGPGPAYGDVWAEMFEAQKPKRLTLAQDASI
jgi:hypothetical protein